MGACISQPPEPRLRRRAHCESSTATGPLPSRPRHPAPPRRPCQEEWSFLLSANLESSFALCQLCHPLLKASADATGDAVVLFNSSVAGGPLALMSGSIYGLTKVGRQPGAHAECSQDAGPLERVSACLADTCCAGGAEPAGKEPDVRVGGPAHPGDCGGTVVSGLEGAQRCLVVLPLLCGPACPSAALASSRLPFSQLYLPTSPAGAGIRPRRWRSRC